MIRIIDIVIGVYLGCGLLGMLLGALLVAAVWGHRHGLSLTEVVCNSTDSKMTFHDYACAILAFIMWPYSIFIMLKTCFGLDDTVMKMLDQSEGYSEAA